MIEPLHLLTIVAMALTTFGCRLLGYWALRNRTLSAKAVAVMEAAPGCVLISLIAPFLVNDQPHELLALLITFLAALRFNLFITLLLSMGSAALLRTLFA